MSQGIDWKHIRRYAWSEERAPDWPKGVRGISLEGVSLFGLDERHRLYWDGRPVEVRRTLTLTLWQRLAAITTVLATVITAISAAAMAWIEVITFSNPSQ